MTAAETEARSGILKFWRGFCMACQWRDNGHPTVELAQAAADTHLREHGSDRRHTHGPPRPLAVAIEDFVPMVVVPEWMSEAEPQDNAGQEDATHG